MTTGPDRKLKSLPLLGSGKVRDNYAVGDDRMLMVTSDRLSAFDVVMAEPIPNKGRVLNTLALFWFDRLSDIVPNHLGVDRPAANRWWWDALRRGPESPYFTYFDFDTEAANGADGRIAIPVLGSPEDVEQLVVVTPSRADTDTDTDTSDTDGAETELHFYDHRFPVAPGTGDGTAQQVHDRQHYRLVHWREPLLGYRRFFTVTGLAGLRQEDPAVFDALALPTAPFNATGSPSITLPADT